VWNSKTKIARSYSDTFKAIHLHLYSGPQWQFSNFLGLYKHGRDKKHRQYQNWKISYQVLKLWNRYQNRYRKYISKISWVDTTPRLLKNHDTIFCDTKFSQCRFKEISNYIGFVFCCQIDTYYLPILQIFDSQIKYREFFLLPIYSRSQIDTD